jgi:ribonuclease PH
MINSRSYQRAVDQMRPVSFERGYLKDAYGSCLVSFGETRVLCAASIDETLPAWRKGSGRGWLTAEYSMLPQATAQRGRRERNGVQGRTQEIQRLIGRSLRTVLDMAALGEYNIIVDCDVIQADGGTRTAAVTGAWIALHDALETWRKAGKLKVSPLIDQVAAVSVGVVDGRTLLDLDYHEDSRAEIDMNLVMTGSQEFVEIQGTGERITFDRARLNSLLDIGEIGLRGLLSLQKSLLEESSAVR